MLAGDVPDGKNVHIGSLINAFEYNYEYPNSGEKFAVNAEVANCPWDQERWLIHIGVRAADINKNKGKDILLVREVRMAVEFNPDRVAGYRLIGEDYTKKFDVNNSPNQIVLDGQTVTALYEIVPMEGTDFSESLTRNANSELVSVRIDYTDPENKDSRSLISSISHKSAVAWEEASEDMRFATSVAGYGLLLGGHEKGSSATYDLVLQLAKDALGEDKNGQRSEFIDWIKKTKNLEERR
jgi:Ca-activated chloride channel family protein